MKPSRFSDEKVVNFFYGILYINNKKQRRLNKDEDGFTKYETSLEIGLQEALKLINSKDRDRGIEIIDIGI